MEIGSAEKNGRYAAGRKVTLWGMVFNILLSAFKITAGLVGHSQAIIADGLHSLSDFGSDVVVLVGLKVSSKPSDGTHHYGHAKVECLATVGVGVLLIAAGVFIAYESFVGITQRHLMLPGCLPIVAAAVSIAVKEVLFQWTRAVARRIESSAVRANAWHHRTDALTSIAVLVGLVIVRMSPSLEILDHLIALVVAVFVVRVALKFIYTNVLELMDSAPGSEVMDRVCESILQVEGVSSLHQCRARRVQGKIYVDVHVQVPGSLTVLEGHRISSVVRDKVKETVESVEEVLVHIEPVDEDRDKERDL